jgi:ribokinase
LTNKPRIVVVGSLNMDIVVNVEELPNEGETLLGTKMSEIPGGKGANQAVAIGKLQQPACMIGKVGTDHYGTRLLASLRENHIETAYIQNAKQSTGIAVITVDSKGKNHIIVVPGANFALTPEDIWQQREAIEKSEIVILQLEIPLETVVYTLQLAKQLGKTTILNPAPAKMLTEDVLKHVDILIPNEHELSKLTGIELQDESDLRKATEYLIDKGVKALIVTLGEKGCCYVEKDTMKMYPAFQVEAKDTTAAGDSFIGGFVASYVEYKNIDLAIEQAQKVAAITVTREGAQTSLPTLEEVNNFSCK